MKEHAKLKEREKDPLPREEARKEQVDEICRMVKQLDDRQLRIVYRLIRRLTE